jgi:hypothetical protein
VAALCRGAALATLGAGADALACFQWAVDRRDRVQRDGYVAAFAMYEAAVLLGPSAAGLAFLRAARGVRMDYNFKMVLHLRLHLMGDEFRRAEALALARPAPPAARA